MIVIFVRAVILYLLVLIGMRLMGKGEIAEMQPFELVITLIIAELAVLPMENLGLPLLNGIIAICTLIFLQILISYINLKSNKAREIICGKPSILIHKGKINEKELNKLRININDLIEQIRSKDYPAISDVEFAILETNGDLSIIPKANKRAVTAEDLNLTPSYEGLPVSLIIDGHISFDNLIEMNLSEDWLRKEIKILGANSPKDVLFAYLDANNKVFIQKKKQIGMK